MDFVAGPITSSSQWKNPPTRLDKFSKHPSPHIIFSLQYICFISILSSYSFLLLSIPSIYFLFLPFTSYSFLILPISSFYFILLPFWTKLNHSLKYLRSITLGCKDIGIKNESWVALKSLSKSAPLVKVNSTYMKHMSDPVNLVAPTSHVYRARYSTNWDRKGRPGLEI